MRKKRAVIVANTVYQLIVAIQMKLTVLKEMEVDLLISDHSVGAEKYVSTGNKTGLFNSIKYIQTWEYVWRKGKYQKADEFLEAVFLLRRFREIMKRVGKLKPYDYVFVSNVDWFSLSLYDTLSMMFRKKIKFYLFEDGLSSYKAFEPLIEGVHNEVRNGKFKRVYKLMKYGIALDKIEGIFLFNPQLFDWKNKSIKKYKIPKINRADKNTINIMNIFFDYKDKADRFLNTKVIFFEESFYASGYSVNDVKFVRLISECVGKEHLLIKLHPRNKINRFKDYNIFEDNSMPWEIIYLNNNFENIELVSISSGSVIHPYIIFGEEKRVVILQELANISISGMLKIYQIYLKEKIFEPNGNIFYMIKNEEELRKYFLEVAENEGSSIGSDKAE